MITWLVLVLLLAGLAFAPTRTVMWMIPLFVALTVAPLVPRAWTAAGRARRRWWISRHGWPLAVHRWRLQQVGPTMPDPGNPGRTISLYRAPAGLDAPEAHGVLIGTNGTPNPDGTHQAIGIPVPHGLPDPIAAAAWTAHMDPADYVAIYIRT